MKSNSDENKTLSVKEYLNKISPYLKDIIISKNLTHGNFNQQQQKTLFLL